MSRDVLIILLVLGLLANVVLVAGVVWINYRAARRPLIDPSSDPGAPVAADDTDPARLLAAGPAPAGAGPTTGSAEGTQVPARAQAQSGLPEPARRPAARRTPRDGAARARSRADARGQGADGSDGAGSAAGDSVARRNRRFVLPDDDGSHARTDRAIAAFLGEPVAPDPETRSGRRRHRARRPAGAPAPRTDLVLSLAGAEPDPRLVHALSAAMRGTVRSSDEVVELPGGRLRISLEADVGGGEAFVRRARTVVKPWLTALDPDLQLRVERPRSRQGAAASSS